MLTIKHVKPFGDEAIYPADQVGYYPYKEAKPAVPAIGGDGPAGVKFSDLSGSVFYADGAERNELLGGTVYVMNDRGSTVAKYDLGGWAQPA